ncbi:MAG: hypothetical protein C4582_04195 [Desulfobacteraceae bacterium]|jgi:hypothetical protein|nr:MAG: hypothetical protein C4582_04195 [Desulfobacteraceae bacterium]
MGFDSGASDLSQNALHNRRRMERFPLRQGAYVLFYRSDSRKFEIVGQLIDISFNGFSFYYVTTPGENQKLVYDYDYDIIIFSLFRMLRLKKYRIVYDLELSSGSSGKLLVRRCGVKFDRLRQSHKIELEQIIRFNAI